jgi:hypothetical protein
VPRLLAYVSACAIVKLLTGIDPAIEVNLLSTKLASYAGNRTYSKPPLKIGASLNPDCSVAESINVS